MIIHKQLSNYLLDILFPRRCVGCEIILKEDKYLCFCKKCFNSIKINGSFTCIFCDTKSTDGSTCPFCAKINYLDQLLPATTYSGVVRKAIKEMKYRYIKDIISDLSGIFTEFLDKQGKKGYLDYNGNEIIISVPMHKRRKNNRGFNQAELLANVVSRNFGLPVILGALKRRFNILPKPQADIKNKKDRIENAENTYKCASPYLVKDKTIWLIDDVATTGATLNDCARALKEAGAKKVVGIVLAKGKLKAKPRIMSPEL